MWIQCNDGKYSILLLPHLFNCIFYNRLKYGGLKIIGLGVTGLKINKYGRDR